MKGLAFTVACFQCAGPMSLLAEGRGTGPETRAMVKCDDCGREALVTVLLQAVATPAAVRRRELRLVTA